MSTALKVVFSGPIAGDVAALEKKIGALNKKNSFDLHFCVGQFFGDNGSMPEQSSMPVATYFIGGHVHPIVCAPGPGSETFMDSAPKYTYLGRSGVITIKGLTVAYLDGTYCEKSYSRPAVDNQPSKHFCEADVQKLKDELNNLEGDVDILLTCEWPKAIAAGVPAAQLPEGLDPSTSGSEIVSHIAALARPRYHISSGEPVHFVRLPYINRDLGAGIRITRFVGLPPTAGKAKSIHALNLTPASALDPEVLCQKPEGCTPSPLDAMLAIAANAKRAQQRDLDLPNSEDWRWQAPPNKRSRNDGGRGSSVIEHTEGVTKDASCTVIARNVAFAASESDIEHFFSQAGHVVDIFRGSRDDGKTNSWISVQFKDRESAEKAVQLTGGDLMGREVNVELSHGGGGRVGRPDAPMGQAVENCWFCLGSQAADVGLVASVGEEAYIAVDKGAINDSHVLVVPIEHYPSSAALKPETFIEVEKYLSALRSCYASQGRELIAFERFLALRKSGGNHCHINVIGVPKAAADRAKEEFMKAATAAGFEMAEVMSPSGGGSSQSSLRALVGGNEYFQAILPGGLRLVKSIMKDERWPMNLGREVLANLAGVPEKADWKLCTCASPEAEEERTETFKQMFKKYDVMQ